MLKSRVLSGAIVILTAFAGAMISTTAAASSAGIKDWELSPNTDVDAEIIEGLANYGVPESSRQELLEKFHNGETWDSLSGAAPVSSESYNTPTERVYIERFEDGSVSASTVDLPSDSFQSKYNTSGVSPMGVSGCQQVSTGYVVEYENCYADVDLVIIQMGFHFDKATMSGVLGSITRYYGMENRIIGGSFSNHRFDKFSPQRVRYSADLDIGFQGFPVGWTAWMEVELGIGNAAWTNNN